MDPARYNRRITIQAPPEDPDSFGDEAPAEQTAGNWTTHATRWASVTTQPGREFLGAGAEQTDLTHWIEMRYLATATTEMRVLYGTRTLDIQTVVHDEAGRLWTRLLCKERG